jgi:hypothetical protein
MGIRSFATELLPQAMRPAPPRMAAPTEAPTTFAGLTEQLHYLGKADLKKVREAYKFADEAHLGQYRASGALTVWPMKRIWVNCAAAASPTSPTPSPWRACAPSGAWTRRP